MATLDYQHILSLARQLEWREQLHLLEALARVIRSDITPTPASSIMDLEGLGQEIWQGIDIAQYIHEERASWGG